MLEVLEVLPLMASWRWNSHSVGAKLRQEDNKKKKKEAPTSRGRKRRRERQVNAEQEQERHDEKRAKDAEEEGQADSEPTRPDSDPSGHVTARSGESPAGDEECHDSGGASSSRDGMQTEEPELQTLEVIQTQAEDAGTGISSLTISMDEVDVCDR